MVRGRQSGKCVKHVKAKHSDMKHVMNNGEQRSENNNNAKNEVLGDGNETVRIRMGRKKVGE